MRILPETPVLLVASLYLGNVLSQPWKSDEVPELAFEAVQQQTIFTGVHHPQPAANIQVKAEHRFLTSRTQGMYPRSCHLSNVHLNYPLVPLLTQRDDR